MELLKPRHPAIHTQICCECNQKFSPKTSTKTTRSTLPPHQDHIQVKDTILSKCGQLPCPDIRWKNFFTGSHRHFSSLRKSRQCDNSYSSWLHRNPTSQSHRKHNKKSNIVSRLCRLPSWCNHHIPRKQHGSRSPQWCFVSIGNKSAQQICWTLLHV